MVRFIAAVALGYLVMAVLVLAAFSVALVAPDFAFRAGSFDVTVGWLAYTLAASLVAATAGGFVAAAVARRRQAASILAALVLILGLGSGLANLVRERPGAAESPAGMSVTERASRAVQPTWYALAVPFLGASAALVGGRIRAEGSRHRPADTGPG